MLPFGFSGRHKDLPGETRPQRSFQAVDGQYQRTIERVLLYDLHVDAGPKAQRLQEFDDRRVCAAGDCHQRFGSRLEAVEIRRSRDRINLGGRDRKPMGARLRAVKRDEESLQDFVGQLVLEGGGEAIGFVPCVAEHVREEPFDDPMPADGGDRKAAPHISERDAAV